MSIVFQGLKFINESRKPIPDEPAAIEIFDANAKTIDNQIQLHIQRAQKFESCYHLLLSEQTVNDVTAVSARKNLFQYDANIAVDPAGVFSKFVAEKAVAGRIYIFDRHNSLLWSGLASDTQGEDQLCALQFSLQ